MRSRKADRVSSSIPIPALRSGRTSRISGIRLKTIVDTVKEPGQYTVTWDGRDEKNNEVVSGIYLVHMDAGDAEYVRKMVLVK